MIREVKGRREREKGFTLVELMIVIAIIAILAAVAITQYTAYKNKAKAKDLVAFARACAMEIVTQCETDSNFDVENAKSSLEACSSSTYKSSYLTVNSINIERSAEGSNISCSSFKVTATGTVSNDGTYEATCTYNADKQHITCTAPMKSSSNSDGDTGGGNSSGGNSTGGNSTGG